ncbi:hypothetical protein AC578_7882 [Lecanosticta acicola]|uniref:Zn(2)-C6 fungal-type domain-containing protein n=1 Tax=Lecanosticta acicola TaxID=111012 RepID=A0AAI9EDK7_9PEZI|nr:hypothetical protein AC578_7882 [Lecanosticta acicola]
MDGVAGPSTSHSPDGQQPVEKGASSPSTETDTPSSSGNQKKIIEVACWPCRRRKGKCTGERPACSSCLRRAVECSYEYEEGVTRLGSLRMNLQKATSRAESLQFLFEQLRTRSDNEAACLLAVIRMGADIDIICQKLKSDPNFLFASPDLSALMSQA